MRSSEAVQRLSGPTEIEILIEDLDLTVVRVEYALGYDNGVVPEPVPELIQQVLEEAPHRLSVRGGYRILDPAQVEIGAESLSFQGIHFDTGRLIAGLLDTAQTFAVFAATAGPGLDDWARQYFQAGDPMTGYVIDAFGTVVAERAAEWMEEHIADTADAIGWTVTSQYGPGYCGWHLSEQHKLFGLLPPGFCGITLSESALMRPIKSVSGVVGLGHRAERKAHGCSICTLTTCFRRHHFAAAD